jgi:hypothetical protein
VINDFVDTEVLKTFRTYLRADQTAGQGCIGDMQPGEHRNVRRVVDADMIDSLSSNRDNSVAPLQALQLIFMQ